MPTKAKSKPKKSKPSVKARAVRGKRPTSSEKVIAEADRLASLIADAPADQGVPLAPPAFIVGVKMRAAVAVWNRMVPLLSDRGLIDTIDRPMFAMFCVYAAEFVAANEDLLKNGLTKLVKTISGDAMLRENPAVSIRDHAAKICMDLSRRFGLSPLDRAYVLKVQKGADIAPPDLFDLPEPPAVEARPVDPGTAEWNALLDQPGRPN